MTTPTTENKEVCTLTIAFPVTSDDEAIDVKKKIGALMSDKPDVMIDFRMRMVPANVLPVR